MNKQSTNKTLLCLCALSLFGMTSCVDNDYDLSKDIDMTVTVGGDELTIPGSNTDTISLRKIFDLDPESTVQADAKGNYALVQTGEGSDTKVTIDGVRINANEINIESATSDLDFEMTPNDELEANVSTETTFDIEKTNVTEDVTELYNAFVEMPASLSMRIIGNQGITLKEGFRVNFPSYLHVTTDDPNCVITDGHLLEFINNLPVSQSNPLFIPLHITYIDFEAMEEGNGLIEPGHLKISDKVTVEGTSSTTGGTPIHITMITSFNIEQIELTDVTAKVDPKIDVTIDPISINNLPDFLQDDNVTIDMTDPRIFLTVSNSSPVKVNFTGTLESFKNRSNIAAVNIPTIVIPAETENYVICLHRQEGDVDGADESVTVANLNDLIATIPDQIKMENIEAKAADERVTLTLGSTYNVKTDYEINAPLQFNEGTNIVYTDSFDGWNSDIKDMEVKEMRVTMDAVNTIPLKMNMEVTAIDADGKPVDGIVTTIDGEIAAGTSKEVATTTISISLKATNPVAFQAVDGLEYKVNAGASTQTAGQVLNENQTLKLNNVKVKVIGGVTVDLN